jgi:hypothetical protein
MDGPGQVVGGVGSVPFDWEALVPHGVHPTKVAVIEAMAYMDQPLSATQLLNLFDCDWSLSQVSYHVTALAKFGVLEKVGERKVRGTMENFYSFAP